MIQERVIWVGFEMSFEETNARQLFIRNVLFSRFPTHSISTHGRLNAEFQRGYNAYMEYAGKILQDQVAAPPHDDDIPFLCKVFKDVANGLEKSVFVHLFTACGRLFLIAFRVGMN
jgi:hypothetical protein